MHKKRTKINWMWSLWSQLPGLRFFSCVNQRKIYHLKFIWLAAWFVFHEIHVLTFEKKEAQKHLAYLVCHLKVCYSIGWVYPIDCSHSSFIFQHLTPIDGWRNNTKPINQLTMIWSANSFWKNVPNKNRRNFKFTVTLCVCSVCSKINQRFFFQDTKFRKQRRRVKKYICITTIIYR